MEVNDYLPTRTRVLSSEIEGKIEPEIIYEALDLDLDYLDEDIELIIKLKEDNKLDVLFKFLFIKQCNKLNEILPGLFEKTEDYKELLLDISFINENGIIRKLVDEISEKEFIGQVEIIGWLYQYYITDLNILVYDGSFKKKKISKELLPFATQIFTPDWVVKYMVDNSLGKLFMENDLNLKGELTYYIESNYNNSIELNVEDIKIIDPCMGSGHILIYVFELLMKIYESRGFSSNDAVISILKNNLYGLDIDNRAYQLAYFAIMMKAREYSRRIFNEDLDISLHSILESNSIHSNFINLLINYYPTVRTDLEYLINIFKDAKEYGSILKIKSLDFNQLDKMIIQIENDLNINLTLFNYRKDVILLKKLIQQAKILSLKYDVVVTNPPYLNSSRFNSKLSNYIKEYYNDVKADLSMVMYKKAIDDFSKPNGYISFITTTSWMYLTKFEKFRKRILKSVEFESLVDFGSELFEGKVGHNLIVAWVNKNIKPTNNFKSVAIRLSNYNYSNRGMKKTEFFNEINKFYFNQMEFSNIPGSPIAYWISDNFIDNYNKFECLDELMDIKQGLATGNNQQFLRYWFEVEFDKIGFNYHSIKEFHDSLKRYAPYNKGGEFKKWYGNCEFVIKFDKENYDILSNQGNHLPSRKYYFNDGITWTLVSSKSSFAARISNEGFVFDVGGSSGFTNQNIYPFLGFLCSNVAYEYLSVLNPTINVQVGDLKKLPFSKEIINKELISLVEENVNLSKKNWDLFEVSWNFNKHPFLEYDLNYLNDIFRKYEKDLNNDFSLIKSNEESINKLIIGVYNLPEIPYSVDDKDITLKLSNYESDIKSFISYAVGCMFGRYSLDNVGLQFAGGKFNLENYKKFIPDDDNIIPVLDAEYFEDDIVGRFAEFVKVCFGEEMLEENLNFIAGALNKKGKTSREIIRNYFLTDFFKNHVQTYKKCPIYWQFDSGKQNAFKCLIYMHRYEPDLVARVRTDYLHKTQKAIELNLAHCDNIIANSSNKSEISKATKDKSKYIKQLDEIKVYDEALRHMATQNIEIDLDEGVKVNYAKFQSIEISKEGEKTKKINLLKKI